MRNITTALSWVLPAHQTRTKQPTIDYLIEHLKIYGNTILVENPKKYEQQLLSAGIRIKYKYVKKPKKQLMNNLMLEAGFGGYYVIEVVK